MSTRGRSGSYIDIKGRRREAGLERQQIIDNYPGVPLGAYGQGSAASDENQMWWARAQSWSMGAGVFSYRAIEDENDAEHVRWGTPYEDLPDPRERGNQNADDPLPDPNNYHSNPGYLGTSTASSLVQSAPGGMYRTAGPRAGHSSGQAHRPMPTGGRRREPTPGRTIVPAGGARQPESEGSPLVVTQGFPGR